MAQRSHGSDTSPLDPTIGETCPFSGLGPNEDELGAELFHQNVSHDPSIGYYRSCHAGFVAEKSYRDDGSSGGMATWILCELMQRGLVDRVVHIRSRLPTAEDRTLFSYQVSDDLAQVLAGAKSRYYPVELSGVLRFIRHNPGRYALIGLPCFIKAVRLLCRRDPLFAERIRYCIGLFCGHLKSTAFAESIAWHLGIAPKDIRTIDFRWKRPEVPAYDYGVKVSGLVEGVETVRQCAVREISFADWGMGCFKYHACDFCDDVVAELADVSIGDAWLPPYSFEWRGTNMLVVRSALMEEMIQEGIDAGRLQLDSVDAQAVVASQIGGFRHRRQDLAHRLFLADRAGCWRPPKRVCAQRMTRDARRKKIIELRLRFAQQSRLAWRDALAESNLGVFTRQMAPLMKKYARLYADPQPRVRLNIRRLFRPLRWILERIRSSKIRRLFRPLRRIQEGDRRRLIPPGPPWTLQPAVKANRRVRRYKIRPLFVLEGIFGVYNYGCEAIVRGTARAIRHRWPSAEILYWSHRPKEDADALQGSGVTVKGNRPTTQPIGLAEQLQHYRKLVLGQPIELSEYIRCSKCLLSIGGDILTLSPHEKGATKFAAVEHARELLAIGKPVVLWSASVGPFEENPAAPQAFGEILRQYAVVAVREDEALHYLEQLGIRENVRSVVDPAFLMEPADDSDPVVQQWRPRKGRPTLAVNLSPLSLRHLDAKDTLTQYQVDALVQILSETDMDLLLTPHVICPWYPEDDDYSYLNGLMKMIPASHGSRVRLLPPDLGAQRTKAVLAACDALIAARMHCAIAGISSGVPSLFLSYSPKSLGLCENIYGHRKFVVPIDASTAQLVDAIRTILSEGPSIRQYLKTRIPRMIDEALHCADVLPF